jgi:hypothetical protein
MNFRFTCSYCSSEELVGPIGGFLPRLPKNWAIDLPNGLRLQGKQASHRYLGSRMVCPQCVGTTQPSKFPVKHFGF